MKRSFLLGAVILFLSGFNLIITEDWSLAKKSHGVRVYTRKTSSSGVKEFKAVSEFTTTMEKISKELNDVDSYTEWMVDLEKAEILEKKSDDDKYIYFELDVPWPYENRDFIIHYQRYTADNMVLINLSNASDYIDAKKGIVRMTIAHGKWAFIPTEEGKIKVIDQFLGDPAGNVPDWITNMFLVNGPHQTLRNLRTRVESQNN